MLIKTELSCIHGITKRFLYLIFDKTIEPGET